MNFMRGDNIKPLFYFTSGIYTNLLCFSIIVLTLSTMVNCGNEILMNTKYQNRDSHLETSGKVVGFYEREFYCFSNFSSFQVKWKGKLWPTSEHAYQASRFMGKNSKIVEKIFKARSADDAYRIAKKYLGNDFDKYGDNDSEKMEDIVRHELYQNPYVMHKLMQTGRKLIVEDSPKDDYWGWGPKRNGRNELGKIWMKLRDEIIKL